MVAGVALGWLNPKLGADMKPFGDGFIALVRMIIGPVIFCTVVHGVTATNDFKKVGRVALKARYPLEATLHEQVRHVDGWHDMHLHAVLATGQEYRRATAAACDR